MSSNYYNRCCYYDPCYCYKHCYYYKHCYWSNPYDTEYEAEHHEEENIRNRTVDINIEASIEQDADANANGGNGGNGGNGNNNGDGGDGGNGGDGGDIDINQEASIEIENVVLISNDPNYSPHYVNLSTNNRKLEINTDSNGNVLVNGQKMNEEELEDGTKVFVFRSNKTKKTEA